MISRLFAHCLFLGHILAGVMILLGVSQVISRPAAASPVHSRATGVSSGDVATRKQAAKNIREHHAQAIAQLIHLATAPSDNDGDFDSTRRLAIDALAMHHAVESCPVLVENITYWSQPGVLNSLPFDAYPCVNALAMMGRPGLDAVVKRLKNDVSAEEVRLFAAVFWASDGEMAEMRVLGYLETISGSQRTNLLRVHEELVNRHFRGDQSQGGPVQP